MIQNELNILVNLYKSVSCIFFDKTSEGYLKIKFYHIFQFDKVKIAHVIMSVSEKKYKGKIIYNK